MEHRNESCSHAQADDDRQSALVEERTFLASTKFGHERLVHVVEAVPGETSWARGPSSWKTSNHGGDGATWDPPFVRRKGG